MGLVKEPDGVDFVIHSKPLTKADEQAISKFISDYKAKHKLAPTAKKTRRKLSSKVKV